MAGPSVFTMSALSSSLSVLYKSAPTVRRRTTTIFTNVASQCSNVRYKSTTRRMTKALRLHPHGSFIGTASTIPSKSSHPPPSLSKEQPAASILPNIIHNPPAAAPTPYITPKLFLPPNDPRYSAPSPSAILTSAPTNTASPVPPRPQVSDGDATGRKLPPALSRPYQKSYHLTEQDIKKIQRMRQANPRVNTRRNLAKQFGTSEFFIGMVAPTTEERKTEMKQKVQGVKDNWGKIRTFARTERTRRRELWSKDL
ncbi:hypothetical protein H072_1332 [Dactylellina haptotyla CBS 200.50]|uniref:Uncharacterized protein n=1 Tax=Dactylellina haptotyla (strain CBS 200.50) TaxID=1284197 RepID=S8AP09_DACHA|nr:hypothetical protein H072_1332 [Dactylellina haptotyla CBS 200.50]